MVIGTDITEVSSKPANQSPARYSIAFVGGVRDSMVLHESNAWGYSPSNQLDDKRMTRRERCHGALIDPQPPARFIRDYTAPNQASL
jgi:hypothetical protein